jgi:hypothetical protein
MIVNKLAFSFMSSLVLLGKRVEIDSGVLGPIDNHFARFLEDRTELSPEGLVAKVSALR